MSPGQFRLISNELMFQCFSLCQIFIFVAMMSMLLELKSGMVLLVTLYLTDSNSFKTNS